MEIRVVVADDAELLIKEYVHKVGKRFFKLGKSRLEMNNFLTGIFSEFIDKGGIVLDRSGQVVEVPEDIVEDAYLNSGTPKSDHGRWATNSDVKWYSWNTDVKAFADRVPLRNPKITLLKRLRMVDIAFKIMGDPIA